MTDYILLVGLIIMVMLEFAVIVCYIKMIFEFSKTIELFRGPFNPSTGRTTEFYRDIAYP